MGLIKGIEVCALYIVRTYFGPFSVLLAPTQACGQRFPKAGVRR